MAARLLMEIPSPPDESKTRFDPSREPSRFPMTLVFGVQESFLTVFLLPGFLDAGIL